MYTYIYTGFFHLHHSEAPLQLYQQPQKHKLRQPESCRPKRNNPVNVKGGACLWWAQNDEWTTLLAVWWCWRFISAQFEGCVISNTNSSFSHRYEGSTSSVLGVCNLFPPSKNMLKRHFWQQRTSFRFRGRALSTCACLKQQIWIQTFLHACLLI